MKITWLSTGTTNCEPIIGSLDSIKLPDWEISVVDYFKGQWITEPADVVLYISVSAGEHLRHPDEFKKLREKSKLIHLCFDASCPDWHPLLETYAKQECFDLTVNIDGCRAWPSEAKDLTLLAPIDPRYFNVVTKDINCGFCGGDGSEQRRSLLGQLADLVTRRPREEGFGTYQGYADFMSRCRIALNMSLCGSGKAKQVKARVIEAALSGCALVEEKDSATQNWFKPLVDYVEYEDARDAREKIQKLTDIPELCFEYATSLQQKVKEKHSPEVFWETVLAEVISRRNGLPEGWA